ncbi:MAG: trypsin-like peptidase domain-containing protein [Acidobacteriota bacterium]
MKISVRSFFLILAVCVAGAWTASKMHTRLSSPTPYFTDGPSVAAADQPYVPASPDESNNIEIYKRVSPAVVNITSTTLDFDFFFNAVPKQGSGSGSLIDSKGHILTNYHVVEGARALEVTLADKRKLKARLVGADPSNDLAVIAIQSPEVDFPVVRLGTSKNLQVGQKVLAIGNPFGLEGTLTTGVISSIHRTIRAENGKLIDDVIQTDAAINPGNSGGPLLNAQGELIGVNTQIVTPSGGNVGIGFAVPVDTARNIIPDLISEGRVRRAFVKLYGYEVGPRLAEILDLPVDYGFLVARVDSSDSFGRAGVRGGRETYLVGNSLMILGGDLIVEIDGQKIDSKARLDRIIENKRPGDTVEVKLYREKRLLTFQVELIERPGVGVYL